MRAALGALLLLALTGCSSTLSPTDAGTPRDDGLIDAGADVGFDLGTEAQVVVAPPPDVSPGCDLGPCTCPDGRSGNYTCHSEWCVCTGPLLCDADAGLQACGGTCIDTTASRLNCGGCGIVCGAGRDCCGGACADRQVDPMNCGVCGHACAPGQGCLGGTCY